jgi:hypothetical protein
VATPQHAFSSRPARWRAWIGFAICIAFATLLRGAYVDGRFVSLAAWQSGQKHEMWNVSAWALAAAVAAVVGSPRIAHRVIALGLGVWAVIAFGPVALAAAALLGAVAAVVGARLQRAFGIPVADPLTATLSGAVVIAAVIAVTAPLKIHWPATYALAFAACLAGFRGDGLAIRRWLSAWWAPRPRATARLAFLPHALLATVVALHVAVAARPEVGHDALAMHLQIAAQLAHDHRFAYDVERHVWAVMPLAGDWLYAAAYQLGGESAAKAVNLGAFLLLLALIARLAQGRSAPNGAAPVALVALFASMPLAFAETSSLFIENYWAALLLGATAAAERAAREKSLDWALASLWLAAGAMQAKVIGVLWIAPLLLALAWMLRDRWRALDRRHVAFALAALVVLAWPYANAWWRTGNPVFPFVNTVFRSPYFDTDTAFNNAAYNASLTWRTWYDIVVDSGRFLEGTPGAPGVHWLLLFPALLVLVRRSQLAAVLPLLGLAALFFVAVYLQQSYLRYLYPAFALLTAVAGRIVAPLPLARGPIAFVAALPLVALNLPLMPSGGWWNAGFCRACGFDASARARHVARFAEQRPLVDWLNANAPAARVGWMRSEYAGPAGFTGSMWRASWHDFPAWRELRTFTTPEQMAAFAERRGSDFFVLPRRDDASAFGQAIGGFRDRYTTAILASGDTLLARWADVPQRRRVTLPDELDRMARNQFVTLEAGRVAFAPRGLAWLELVLESRSLTYRIVADCAPGEGRGVVNFTWLDEDGTRLSEQSQVYACADDGRVAEASVIAPVRARRCRVYVGSAVDQPFALRSFTLSAR